MEKRSVDILTTVCQWSHDLPSAPIVNQELTQLK